MRPETRLVRFDAAPGDPHAPSSTPIYQTATFHQSDPTRFDAYDYSRSGNPTRTVLEDALAALEGGAGCTAFASGVAALSAVVRPVCAGETIVAGDDLYGGTHRLLRRASERCGVRVVFADLSDEQSSARALTSGARLVLCETPTNPRQRVVDLARLARQCRDVGARLAVDNTFLSPWLQNPLAHGADLVVHSATKHLGGHGDVTAGAVVAADPEVAREIAADANAEGSCLAPFDAWLLLRGLRTLGVRIEREQASAEKVAAALAANPNVTRLHWVGDPAHPGAAIHAAQARGPGSVISFETHDAEQARLVVAALHCFDVTVSFGAARSSASIPWYMSHASIPEAQRRGLGLTPALIRLSIGLEHPADLVEDLEAALDRCANRSRSGIPVSCSA